MGRNKKKEQGMEVGNSWERGNKGREELEKIRWGWGSGRIRKQVQEEMRRN